MKLILTLIPATLLLLLPTGQQAEPPQQTTSIPATKTPRDAIHKALPIIQKSMKTYRERRKCYSCHHHALPILMLSEVKQRGFTIEEKTFNSQVMHTASEVRKQKERLLKGRGPGGGVDSAGWSTWALEAGGYKPDDATAAMVEYVLIKDRRGDHWSGTSTRPPTQTSDLTRAALCLKALDYFGTEKQQKRIQERKEKVRRWLKTVKVDDNEDKVFRLWALAQLGNEEEMIARCASDLIADQQEDGGWRQNEDMATGAYATGSALVALHKVGALSTKHEVYQRGVKFLLDNQREDGSWQVLSHARPVQVYFESGFPHGRDQFISMYASCWATMALALTLPKASETKPEPLGDSSANSGFDRLLEEDRKVMSARFEKEIWPLFTRRGKDGCAGCHTPKHRSGLRFSGDPDRDFRGMLKDGFFLPKDTGSVLYLVQTDGSTRMPPGSRPRWTKKEIDLLQRFVTDLDKKQQK